MTEYFIRVSYRNHQYVGKSSELTEEEKTNLEDLLTKVAKGKANHFQIENGDGSIHFFPKKLLKKCVITLVKDS